MKPTNFFRRTIMTRPLYKKEIIRRSRSGTVGQKGAGDSTERSEFGPNAVYEYPHTLQFVNCKFTSEIVTILLPKLS
jgi:hypothetical protein